MRLDLTTLADDRTPVVGDLSGADLEVPSDDFEVEGAVHLDGMLERLGAGEYRATGALDGTLRVPCSRCLEPFTLPLSGGLDVRLLPAAQLEASAEHEIGDDDLATEFYRDETIDVAGLVREQCYLALPMKPLCRPDCRGLCPQCGANLNQTICACDQTWVDPRLAVLKALVPDRPPE